MTASSSSRPRRRPPSPRSSDSRNSAPRISAARAASLRADLGGTARAHLAARQVDDAEAVARGLQARERAAAGQLDVVGMRGDREDVNGHGRLLGIEGEVDHDGALGGVAGGAPRSASGMPGPQARIQAKGRVDALGRDSVGHQGLCETDAAVRGHAALALDGLAGAFGELLELVGDLLARRVEALPRATASSTVERGLERGERGVGRLRQRGDRVGFGHDGRRRLGAARRADLPRRCRAARPAAARPGRAGRGACAGRGPAASRRGAGRAEGSARGTRSPPPRGRWPPWGRDTTSGPVGL